MSALPQLSLRGRVIVAGLLLGGLGLGVAPLASAGTDTTVGVPIIKVAAKYQGVPYRYGGTSTRGFDCSGYVQFVFHKLGVSLPRTAEQQYEAVKHLKRSQLRVGDLVFFGGRGWVYHVGIYAGDNMFWDAPHTGDRVRLQKIWGGAKVYGRVRGLKVPAVTPSTVPTPGAPTLVAPSPVAPFPDSPVAATEVAAPGDAIAATPPPSATSTPTPSATSTPPPSATSTPTPSATSTPTPSATSTSTPSA